MSIYAKIRPITGHQGHPVACFFLLPPLLVQCQISLCASDVKKRYNKEIKIIIHVYLSYRTVAVQGAEVLRIFIVYLIIMNIVSFFTMAYDKAQAGKRKRRVPEKRLFGYAALGGALGAWIGMYTWRHKTKHASFIAGVPALLIVNVVLIYFIVKGLNS
jgi:uncharacterized membrane protein YsdA (DUF1294 family)